MATHSLLFQSGSRLFDCLLLDIERVDMAVMTNTPGKEEGVVPVTHGRIDHAVAGCCNIGNQIMGCLLYTSDAADDSVYV